MLVATWDYSVFSSHVWHGRDGGNEGYYNLFCIIPKGNGWKGQYADKDLMLIDVISSNSDKRLGDIGVFERM